MGLGFLGRGKNWQMGMSAALHVLGALAGGAIVGWILGWVGAVSHLTRWWLVVIGAAFVFALWHALRGHPDSLGLRRQVPSTWARTMHPAPRFFLWGLLLGSGIAVVIPYSVYVLLLATQLTAGSLLGAASGAAFGAIRSASALLLLASQERRQHPEHLPALLPVLMRAGWRWNLLGILGGFLVLMLAWGH